MKKHQEIGALLLRLTMAATFLSAVASRLGVWGSQSSGWDGFVKYTASVNSFLPPGAAPLLAIIATVLETGLATQLIIGFKTRWAALGAAILTLMFATAMACSFGLKSPLDYSVFVDCSACFLLATFPDHRWSLDQWLSEIKATNP